MGACFQTYPAFTALSIMPQLRSIAYGRARDDTAVRSGQPATSINAFRYDI